LFVQILPYILESNQHPFYSFRELKNQMRITIACGLQSLADYSRLRITVACGLDLRSRAGFWKNDGAAVRAVRTIQYNNLILFITYYNLLFIRFAVITHN
jgi:hypothetical protein